MSYNDLFNENPGAELSEENVEDINGSIANIEGSKAIVNPIKESHEEIELILEKKIEIIETEYQKLYETKINEIIVAEREKYQQLMKSNEDLYTKLDILQRELDYYKDMALSQMEDKLDAKYANKNTEEMLESEKESRLVPLTDQIRTKMKFEKYKTDVQTTLKDHYEKEKTALKKELDNEKAEVGRLKSQLNIKLKKLNEHKRKIDVEVAELKEENEARVNEMKRDIEEIVKINQQLVNQNTQLKKELDENQTKNRDSIFKNEHANEESDPNKPARQAFKLNYENKIQSVDMNTRDLNCKPKRLFYRFEIIQPPSHIQNNVMQGSNYIIENNNQKKEPTSTNNEPHKKRSPDKKKTVLKAVDKEKPANSQSYNYNDLISNKDLVKKFLKPQKQVTTGTKHKDTISTQNLKEQGSKHSCIKLIEQFHEESPKIANETSKKYYFETTATLPYPLFLNIEDDDKNDKRMKMFLRFVNEKYVEDISLLYELKAIENALFTSQINDYLLLDNAAIKERTKSALIAKYNGVKNKWDTLYTSNAKKIAFLTQLRDRDTLNEIQQQLNEYDSELSSSISKYRELYQMFKLRAELIEKIYQLFIKKRNSESFINESMKHWRQLMTLLKDVKQWRKVDEKISSICYYVIDVDSMIDADEWNIDYIEKQKIRISVQHRIKKLK